MGGVLAQFAYSTVTLFPSPKSLLQHVPRPVHPGGVIPHGIFCRTLSLRQPVSQGGFDGQACAILFTLSLNIVTRSQLDAIPTVGFSNPILSYFSALQFNFNGERMLKEGYEKVLCLSFYAPFLVLTDDPFTFRQDQVYSKSPIFGDGWC
jgi:hypothetical protein